MDRKAFQTTTNANANADLLVLSDSDELARAAAERFVNQSIEAVRGKGVFTVALSGGSTPKRLYELLADPDEPFREQLPWDKTHFFWTDERHVPPDHSDSNYRMVNEAMLSCVPVPKENLHRMPGENPSASEAADEYEKTLRTFFKLNGGNLPRFDLILLGLGADGHTASIFPGSEVLRQKRRLVAAPWVEKLKSYRITITPPVINNGALILFLVSGLEKAGILRDVLQGVADPVRYPAQLVKPTNGRLLWLADNAAATGLEVNRYPKKTNH